MKLPQNPTLRRARNLSLGLAALTLAAVAPPGNATAGHEPHEITERIERVAYQVKRIKKIDSLRAQDRAIDRLQARLDRLERINDRQYGRRARKNADWIDRLQNRLARMEYRIEAQLDRRHGYRDHRRAWERSRGHHRHRDFTWRY